MMAVIKFIISNFWPVFVPFIIYFIVVYYLRVVRKKDITESEGKIFKMAVYSTFVVALFTFVYLFVSIELKQEHYVPTRVENGVLVPSKVE